jgi:hypothetical protein
MDVVTSAQGAALLTVVYRVAIHVRASIRHRHPFPPDQLEALMNAIHNIPLLLNSGDHGYWSAVRTDLQAYDQRFASEEPSLRLQEIFLEAGGAFPTEPTSPLGSP